MAGEPEGGAAITTKGWRKELNWLASTMYTSRIEVTKANSM